MAHVAELDNDNKVVQVIVVSNDITDPEQFATDLLGGRWVQTSYNSTIRKHFAGIGFTYDIEIDAFIPPKCHEVATLNKESAIWECGDPQHEAKTK